VGADAQLNTAADWAFAVRHTNPLFDD